MGDVNLIPADRLAKKHRNARLRAWALIIGAYLLLLATVILTAQIFWGGDGDSIEEERKDVELRIQERNSDLVRLRREIAEAAAELQISKAILGQPDWSKLLGVLGAELGEEIVLSQCWLATLDPDGREVTKNLQQWLSSSPLGALLSERRYGLRLCGFGRSQGAVSEFLLRLERLGVFESVGLVNSYRQPFLNSQAVAFNIECRI
jgi:hypothetical protein